MSREIKVGDEVVLVEHWNDETTNNVMGPSSDPNCWMFGFCLEVREGAIVADYDRNTTAPGVVFPTSFPTDGKQGTSVAYHIDDFNEMFPDKVRKTV